MNLIVTTNLVATTAAAINNRDWSMLLRVAQATPYNLMMLKKYNTRRSTRRTSRNILKKLTKAAAFGASIVGVAQRRIPLKWNGQPDFFENRHRNQPAVFMKYQGSRTLDIRILNERYTRDGSDYTWHHHEVLGGIRVGIEL